MTQLDLSNIDLAKTTFDSFTHWPASERLPEGSDPDKVMEWGKYPGLGVRQLHNQGITGKGVHVAIIDQPLLLDHIEYQDQLASYTEIQTGDADPQMHGPAVASLLVAEHVEWRLTPFCIFGPSPPGSGIINIDALRLSR